MHSNSRARAVEHAQALSHMIERGAQHARLDAAAGIDEQAGKRRGAEAERRGERPIRNPIRRRV